MRWNSLESYALATSHALEEAALEPVNESAKLKIRVVMILVAAFVLWAALFRLDIVAAGNGKVVPVSTVQQLQSLESGVISEILVQEGEIVSKGQVLVKMNPAQALGDVEERKATRVGLLASIARLRAESNGVEPIYPEKLQSMPEGPKAVENEEKLRNERYRTLAAQEEVLRQQRDQRSAEKADKLGRLPKIKVALDLVRQQIALTQPLVESKAAAPIEVIQLRKEEANLAAQVISLQHNSVSASAQVREVDGQIKELTNKFRADALEEMNKRIMQLNALEGGLTAKQDVLDRTDVRSPVDGIVKTLAINTVGGVATAGRTLIEIVPLGDTLLVEARMSPNDIAYIKPKQRAKVRVTAFDTGLFGAMDGEVERVSPDSQSDENTGQTYFRVYVRTQVNSIIGPRGNKLSILPGMLADIDIITGHQTVANYLLRPIARGLARSMGEQ